jgi:hypothetical protein
MLMKITGKTFLIVKSIIVEPARNVIRLVENSLQLYMCASF